MASYYGDVDLLKFTGALICNNQEGVKGVFIPCLPNGIRTGGNLGHAYVGYVLNELSDEDRRKMTDKNTQKQYSEYEWERKMYRENYVAPTHTLNLSPQKEIRGKNGDTINFRDIVSKAIVPYMLREHKEWEGLDPNAKQLADGTPNPLYRAVADKLFETLSYVNQFGSVEKPVPTMQMAPIQEQVDEDLPF